MRCDTIKNPLCLKAIECWIMQSCIILSSLHYFRWSNRVANDILLSDAQVTKLMNLTTCSLNFLLLSTYVIMFLVLNNRSCCTLFTPGCISILTVPDYDPRFVKCYHSAKNNTVPENSIWIIWKRLNC